MARKNLILFALLMSLGTSVFVLAQEQSSSGSMSAVDSQGIRTYLLGPGDILDVRVFGQSDLNSTVEIDSDGNISSLPFLEAPIRAQCRSDKDVQRDITKAYGKYILNPQVSVRISERKSRQPATISGAVKAPMQVTMLRKVRLHELITKAGGWTERASGTIQIMHTESEMCPDPSELFQKTALSSNGNFGITIFKISDLKLGREEADPVIRPGDIVIVTEAEPIYVMGAVMAGRELPLRDQLTLGRAIAMAGGPQRLANTSEVHIYRTKDGVAGQEDLKY
ncbi:MAG: polysaccharide biosynthesis/export protein, partial [Blastocatellia bacterium]|nr:polysaccharide biosynthesis/export protein [Blastocatellia bacterium]